MSFEEAMKRHESNRIHRARLHFSMLVLSYGESLAGPLEVEEVHCTPSSGFNYTPATPGDPFLKQPITGWCGEYLHDMNLRGEEKRFTEALPEGFLQPGRYELCGEIEIISRRHETYEGTEYEEEHRWLDLRAQRLGDIPRGFDDLETITAASTSPFEGI